MYILFHCPNCGAKCSASKSKRESFKPYKVTRYRICPNGCGKWLTECDMFTDEHIVRDMKTNAKRRTEDEIAGDDLYETMLNKYSSDRPKIKLRMKPKEVSGTIIRLPNDYEPTDEELMIALTYFAK